MGIKQRQGAFWTGNYENGRPGKTGSTGKLAEAGGLRERDTKGDMCHQVAQDLQARGMTLMFRTKGNLERAIASEGGYAFGELPPAWAVENRLQDAEST